jgi:hypothetical protein
MRKYPSLPQPFLQVYKAVESEKTFIEWHRGVGVCTTSKNALKAYIFLTHTLTNYAKQVQVF